MSCSYCAGTGKYKQPCNKKLFDELIDTEMEKGYYVNYIIAEEKAYKRVGYKLVPCPYCTKSTATESG